MRAELDSKTVQVKSTKLTDRAIRQIDWNNVKAVHCFTSLADQNEPNTKALFDYIWSKHPKINTYTTLKVGYEWRMGKVRRGMFTETISDLPNFDIIFIPMLGFDEKMNRLGYGAGFYDRFLATQPKAKKIGLCFEVGKVDNIPTEPHDISMDEVITELKVY